MPKPSKTQWDFGELFPPEATGSGRKIFSVSELTGNIRRALEKQVGLVWVTGELTNLKSQSSGHIYFTIKDAGAQLSCVLFRGEIQVDRTVLQDGRKVTLQGEITVYEARGQYQLRVLAAELQGIGALQIAFEKLKQRLNAAGWFAPERKRRLPRYPRRIGLVTSSTGAAIRDVLHVIERRNPALEIVLAACKVQGQGAAQEIAAAIGALNQFSGRQAASPQGSLDLILVTRGGGSLEDLWAFNEEVVARAIFESSLPVVSAIGHEIDFTISDFVADVRAATPSAAAEIITEGVFSSCQFVSLAAGRLRQLIGQHLEDKTAQLARQTARLARAHPRRRLNDGLQRIDDLELTLRRCGRQELRRRRELWQTFAARLGRVRPAVVLKQRREVLRQEQQRLQEQARHQLSQRKQRIEGLVARLRLLGPEQVLARGYSITLDAETGKVLRSPAETRGGQKLRTRLKAGQVRSVVEE
jgi:exodeoxyribonuclease VII large subunit